MNVATLAAAVAAALNASDIVPNPCAVRAFVADAPLEGLAERRVVVIPVSRETVRNSRSTFNRELVVNVAVQRQAQGNELLIDEDIAYAETLDDFLRTSRTVGAARWVSAEANHIHDHLRQQGVLTAVLSVTYEIDVIDD